MKTNIQSVLITLFACFAFLPAAEAVNPPPDGGYPGFNTAEGQNALFNLTTGSANTAVGWFSLWGNTAGSFNTATGAGTLLFNTAEQNTAFGTAALLFNTTGTQNTAVGTAALLNNTEGFFNTATGVNALQNNTTGGFNTATGRAALSSNTEGDFNTANGAGALSDNTTGFWNTAIGNNALGVNTTGNSNTANGLDALAFNSIGNSNTANGLDALRNNTGGNFNTAIGTSALSNNANGSGNVALGALAGEAVTTADNVICIGLAGANVSNTCYIGNIFGVTSAGATAVYVNSIGKLGTVASSLRFKDEIKPMDKASEAILALKPVTFRYKEEIDPAHSPQFGLVAEDVQKVNPDLVVRDAEGKVNTVRYEAVNAMLLNEFLKEHRTVQEQGATIARQQKQIDALTAGLQQVSAQLEASKPAPQGVNNQ